MKAELDIKPFLKAINEFRTASRKKTDTVLKQVGKLEVRDAMSLALSCSPRWRPLETQCREVEHQNTRCSLIGAVGCRNAF